MMKRMREMRTGRQVPAVAEAGEPSGVPTDAVRLRWTEIGSPIGPLVLCATDGGLCHIDFGTFAQRGPQLAAWSAKYGAWLDDEPAATDGCLEEAKAQLEAYFAGTTTSFDLPLQLLGTPFQRRVWQELLRIPYGEVRSYKEVAQGIGSPRAVRAVGGANNRNPVPIIVPCHRVIGADGSMVGYGGGMAIKTFLLNFEKPGSRPSMSR